MKRTPKVVNLTEEEEEAEEQAKTQRQKVELTPLQQNLKQLSKQKAKYHRQFMKSQSEEDKQRCIALMDNIDDMRFILRLSDLNKNIINKILKFIEYDGDVSVVQALVEAKITEGDF